MHKQNFYTNVVGKILIDSIVQVNSQCNTQEWSAISICERDIQKFVHNTISHPHHNLLVTYMDLCLYLQDPPNYLDRKSVV